MQLQYNEPLAQHTSWHVGGVAEQYYRPENLADLVAVLKATPADTPITWLGLGSNVLISDSGIKGLVIHTKNTLNNIELLADNTIKIAAGVSCAKVARFVGKQRLYGAEFFAGIPGTMGGALAMNAGAFGGATWDHVVQVITINSAGLINTRQKFEYSIGYRSVQVPVANEWFIAAILKFPDHNTLAEPKDIKILLRQRNNSQPIGVFSGGSVFKNPPGDYAGRLIEAADLKGYSIGSAVISPKHGNFIINTGKATAADIMQLMAYIQNTVLEKFNIVLEP
ncbi:MAG: UDP-N-acetylenolpyruvoylglucosamine reductase, partial [Legionellales bacterium]